MTSKEYQHLLEFEHQLINRRITWLLTSESILFAAFALTPTSNALLDGVFFRKCIALTGISVATLVLVGVIAAIAAKIALWSDYKEKFEKKCKFPLGVRWWITIVGFVPDVLIPVTFAVAWAFVHCPEWLANLLVVCGCAGLLGQM